MTQLLQNAAYGTALILAVAVLRRVLKERLIPEARLALWAVCLFRLLTPAAPESMLSLWGLGRWFGWGAQSAPTPGPGLPVSNMGGMPAPAVTAPAPAPVAAAIPWGLILTGIWLAVGAALAVRYAVSYARTRRAVGETIPIGRGDARYAPLPKCARLREGPMDGAPLTFGAVRPTVVLSPGLDGPELACVLAHEGVHARRRDNLWHYAMALALAAHWWNPAVWLMARLLRRDIELSCDRAAVKRLGADMRADYAKALVSMATMAEGPAFCQTFGRKAAEERIISIMKYKKTSIIGVVLSLTLVAGITVAFASNPAAVMPDEESKMVEPDPMTAVSEGVSSGNQFNEVELLEKYLDGTVANKPDYVVYPDTPREAFLAEYKDFLSRCVAEGIRDESEVDCMLADLENAVAEADEGRIWDLKFNKNGDGSFCYVLDSSLGSSPNSPIDDYTEGTIGEKRYDFRADPVLMSLDEYQALLDGLVSSGKMTQKDADWLLDGATKGLEGQTTPYLRATEDGGYAIMGSGSGGYNPDGVLYRWHLDIPSSYTDQNCDVSVPLGEDIPVFAPDYDPNVQDSAVTGGGAIGCPPEVIDQNFSLYGNPMTESSTHHSESHHSDHH